MAQVACEPKNENQPKPQPKGEGIPIAPLFISPVIRDAKGNEQKNPTFNLKDFQNSLIALSSLIKEEFEIYDGLKKGEDFKKLIDSLTRISSDKAYNDIKLTAINLDDKEKPIEIPAQAVAKEILICILGRGAGKYPLSKETRKLFEENLDAKKAFLSNLSILCAISKNENFNKDDQQFLLNLINNEKSNKEDTIKKAAVSALAFSIFYNPKSKEFGIPYLQQEITSLDNKSKKYAENLEIFCTIVTEVRSLANLDLKKHTHLQESEISLELSKHLTYKNHSKELYLSLLDATITAGISTNNYKEIKNNLNLLRMFIQSKDCTLLGNEKDEISTKTVELIDLLDKQFAPKLPPPPKTKNGLAQIDSSLKK